VEPENALLSRTKQLAMRVICLTKALPKNAIGQVIGKQLLRCATSVGANYRSACRSRSDKDFLARMGIVEEEADETMYWLELLMEEKIIDPDRLTGLYQETEEILKMIAASIITVKRRLKG
jgi:four helix bundle protein